MKTASLLLRRLSMHARGAAANATALVRVAYLRMRVRCAIDELEELRARLDWLPRQMDSHRQYIQRWNREITAILDAQTQRQLISTQASVNDLSDARDQLFRIDAARETRPHHQESLP